MEEPEWPDGNSLGQVNAQRTIVSWRIKKRLQFLVGRSKSTVQVMGHFPSATPEKVVAGDNFNVFLGNR